jgi:hypothetical protein
MKTTAYSMLFTFCTKFVDCFQVPNEVSGQRLQSSRTTPAPNLSIAGGGDIIRPALHSLRAEGITFPILDIKLKPNFEVILYRNVVFATDSDICTDVYLFFLYRYEYVGCVKLQLLL